MSGIKISKVVFAGSEDRAMQVWHYFAAALALAFAGVHIGLHWEFIKGMFGKVVRLPKMLGRVLGVILIAAMLAYGGYSAATSGFTRWMTAPFTAPLPGGAGPGGENLRQFAAPGGGLAPQGERPADGNFPQFQRKDSGKGAGPGLGEGSGMGNGPGNHSGGRSDSVIGVIAAFGAITGLFATVTAFIAKLLKRKKAPAENTEITPQANPAE